MWELVAANTNLPTTTVRIVGRRDVIELILQDLREVRLMSVVGAGGIGKTTVALAVAELAVDSFEGGVWLVDFAPLKDQSLVPNAIAAAIGLVVHSADTLTALCKFLGERRTLLVLDNCEHMLDAIAPCLNRILAEAPAVHVLTTTRAPMGLPGERVHRLPGLAVPPDSSGLTAARALTFAAVDLFVERAHDRLESFELSDADAPIVADICRALDGIALAIELAAMRVDVFGPRGLHKQLDDRFRLLQGRRGGLERHRALAATLDWSFNLLAAREADLLCAVSVFAGVFRNHDAAAISRLSDAEAAASLTELAAHSLLWTEGGAAEAEASYRPLETTRAYCLEKRIANAQDAALRSRHAEYVCAVVQRAAAEQAQRPAAEWTAYYGPYLDDLRDALAWARREPTRRDLMIQLTTAGTALWNHFSLTNESRVHLGQATRALEAANLVGTGVEMNLQLSLAGATLYTVGMVPEARGAMDRALELACQRGDTEYQLRCLRMVASYQLFHGENDAAVRTLQEFVAKAALADASALPEGETHLSCVELFIGLLAPARQRLERLYAEGLKELDDSDSLRFLYNNTINVMIVQSHVQWLTGSPGAAERTAAMVLETSRQSGHELSMSNGLAWVALVFLWMGRVEECRHSSAMLSDLVGKHGIVIWGPLATFCRGALAAMNEETRAEGIALLEQAVAECHAIGHGARLPYFTGVLAEALAQHGSVLQAEARIQEAIALATRCNDNWSLPELLRIRAMVLAARGQAAEQEAALLSSLDLAREQGARSWQLRSAIDLARLLQKQSRAPEGARVLRPIFDNFQDGLDTRDLVTAAKLLEAFA